MRRLLMIISLIPRAVECKNPRREPADEDALICVNPVQQPRPQVPFWVRVALGCKSITEEVEQALDEVAKGIQDGNSYDEPRIDKWRKTCAKELKSVLQEYSRHAINRGHDSAENPINRDAAQKFCASLGRSFQSVFLASDNMKESHDRVVNVLKLHDNFISKVIVAQEAMLRQAPNYLPMLEQIQAIMAEGGAVSDPDVKRIIEEVQKLITTELERTTGMSSELHTSFSESNAVTIPSAGLPGPECREYLSAFVTAAFTHLRNSLEQADVRMHRQEILPERFFELGFEYLGLDDVAFQDACTSLMRYISNYGLFLRKIYEFEDVDARIVEITGLFEDAYLQHLEELKQSKLCSSAPNYIKEISIDDMIEKLVVSYLGFPDVVNVGAT
ncbi:hypothetical protein PAPHI01_1086 [Pancytospora philotis]|nr:hypothetical protein PAPHI01_1086 [Pancytospora philotis]